MLKLIAAATTTAALAPVLHARARYLGPPGPDNNEGYDTWFMMGRAIYPVTFYDKPSTSARRLTTRTTDQSFFILGKERAPFSAHNDLWYLTYLGYVHSAWVLPIRVYPPQPFIRQAGEWGFWGQAAQIYTIAYAEPNLQSAKKYRLYGGTVYHVLEAFEDEAGTGWYKIYDDFPPKHPSHQWVLAQDVRRIPREEMAPIHPFVGNKRIEVNLSKQELTCFEGDLAVFSTRTASGIAADGTGTPTGNMTVLLKQASRHMSNAPYPGGPPLVGEFFDLPGVPWNTFFDLAGTAIHGTYWHNDFGVQRSHGCVNVSCDAARWVYRWTHPIGGFEDEFIQSDKRVGTPIIIF
jgi:lipoprotein-anchoring transpeptidase ErfK/SrfK